MNNFEALQKIPLEINTIEKSPKNQNEISQNSLSNVLERLKKETQAKIQVYKNTINALEQQIKSKDDEIKKLKEYEESLTQENIFLKEQIEKLQQEKEELVKEQENLKEIIKQLQEKHSKEEAFKQSILKSLTILENTINQKNQLAIEEIQEIVYAVLESLYVKCIVNLEPIIKDIIEQTKLFKSFIIIKANKTFIENFKKYVDNIKNVEISFVEEDFEDGEFQIETRDFVLERFNKDIIKDAVEKAIQNIR